MRKHNLLCNSSSINQDKGWITQNEDFLSWPNFIRENTGLFHRRLPFKMTDVTGRNKKKGPRLVCSALHLGISLMNKLNSSKIESAVMHLLERHFNQIQAIQLVQGTWLFEYTVHAGSRSKQDKYGEVFFSVCTEVLM